MFHICCELTTCEAFKFIMDTYLVPTLKFWVLVNSASWTSYVILVVSAILSWLAFQLVYQMILCCIHLGKPICRHIKLDTTPLTKRGRTVCKYLFTRIMGYESLGPELLLKIMHIISVVLQECHLILSHCLHYVILHSILYYITYVLSAWLCLILSKAQGGGITKTDGIKALEQVFEMFDEIGEYWLALFSTGLTYICDGYLDVVKISIPSIHGQWSKWYKKLLTEILAEQVRTHKTAAFFLPLDWDMNHLIQSFLPQFERVTIRDLTRLQKEKIHYICAFWFSLACALLFRYPIRCVGLHLYAYGHDGFETLQVIQLNDFNFNNFIESITHVHVV